MHPITLFPLRLFQDHYDFGMRAVKTVISTAGNLKKENPTMDEVNMLCASRCQRLMSPFLQP